LVPFATPFAPCCFGLTRCGLPEVCAIFEPRFVVSAGSVFLTYEASVGHVTLV